MLYSFLKKIYLDYLRIRDFINKVYVKNVFYLMRVRVRSFKTFGRPIVRVSSGGKFEIGENFTINNGFVANLIGRQQPCFFIVGPEGQLEIGNNVGISSSAIVCREKIVIEDHVLIGGNTAIYDTDFHPVNFMDRLRSPDKYSPLIKNNPVFIKEHAFIGAHTTILKGVTIGERSVIGAGSVVTKNVPPDEIWAGNPARFIKKNTTKPVE